MEEVLTGETSDDAKALAQRATGLLSQLGVAPSADPRLGISPIELAETIMRTLHLPEVAALRSRLVPEYTVHGHTTGAGDDHLVAGIADAVAIDDDGTIEVVADWKSDVSVYPAKLDVYRGQLEAYQKNTSAKRALLVLMTQGKILELDRSNP